jgi:hypothetical protein
MNKNINFVHGKYFFGNEISEYGQKNGYVDYGTLARHSMQFSTIISWN